VIVDVRVGDSLFKQTRSFTVYEVSGSFAVNGVQNVTTPTTGSVETFTDVLYSKYGQGSTNGICNIVSVTGTATTSFPDVFCTETYSFNSHDSLVIVGLQLGAATESDPAISAIVGGTGRFRKARGEARTFTTDRTSDVPKVRSHGGEKRRRLHLLLIPQRSTTRTLIWSEILQINPLFASTK
jgi:hypothetical protein